ncbi:hypothetical protein [Streptomyces sp. TRM68367]|nr:hypothetical protein [Streptomyces sp. TRM68367]MBC9730746.1 hypothetical protein [Streptomyces sp. TRM68367]
MVRTLVLRLERTGRQPESVAPHAAGTLHHIYVITGKPTSCTAQTP